MWQTVIVALLVAAVLIYLVRHFLAVFRSEVPTCSGGCSGCGGGVRAARPVEPCDCAAKEASGGKELSG